MLFRSHGSGPAYIYLVAEAMIDAAVRLGMKRPDASALVLSTIVGAARYAVESGTHVAELRNAVTSLVARNVSPRKTGAGMTSSS